MKIVSNENLSLFESAKILIVNAEGFSATPYKDIFGIETIGYGFDEKYLNSMGHINKQDMTIDEADKILEVKINDLINEVKFKISSFGKNKNIYPVLIDMAYNLGWTELKLFNVFLSYLEEGEIEMSVVDLTNTLWYQQLKNRGVRNCLNLLARNYLILI